MKVAIVAGICVGSDAISQAVANQAEALLAMPGVEAVDVFAHWIGRELPCPGHGLGDPWQLVTHPRLREADVVIFHWGIYYSLFDAIHLIAGDPTMPRVAVHFHNCTPFDLAPASQREVLEASRLQYLGLGSLPISTWTFSRFNELTLRDWGVQGPIGFVPFPIGHARPMEPRRRSGHVDLLSLGRVVPAKGQDVLVRAVSLLPESLRARLTIRIAGNDQFGDQDFQRLVRASITELGVADVVHLVGQPTDGELAGLFEQSHAVVSTSYHEGLCVPIVEGYMAGCRAIGTTAGNLPYLVQTPDFVVEPGDPVALASAIEQLADQVLSGAPVDLTHAGRIAAMYGPGNAERRLRRAITQLLSGEPEDVPDAFDDFDLEPTAST